jgi:hypothetical protein
MITVRQYLARIGRRGGLKSRRVLQPEAARRMVEIREARRAAHRALGAARASRHGGTPADTAATAQIIQDALLRRVPPSGKLSQVARLSRMVDLLSLEGYLRAELRLGRKLAARVFGARRDLT